MTRRRALDVIADLLGVPRAAVRAVERRSNGAYAIVIRADGGPMPRWAGRRRTLRIPRRRVEGYRQVSPYARPRDVRARRKVNAERFAWWLYWRLKSDPAPVVERALHGDLEAIAEFRAAIVAAAPPEPEPEPEFVFYLPAGSGNGNGRAAA